MRLDDVHNCTGVVYTGVLLWCSLNYVVKMLTYHNTEK